MTVGEKPKGGELDPSIGAVRWAAKKGSKHLNRFLAGGVILGLASAVLSNLLVAPTNATGSEKLAYAVAAFVVAVFVAAGGAFGWALIRAPFEQRDTLRLAVMELGTALSALTSESNRRQTPEYQRHRDDQHNFAAAAKQCVRQTVGRGPYQTNSFAPIAMLGQGGKNFRAHLPDVAALIDEWNASAINYEPTSAAREHAVQEETRAATGSFDSALRQVLARIVSEEIGPGDVALSVEEGWVQATLPNDQTQKLCGAPAGNSGESDALLTRIQLCIATISSRPQVVAWRECYEELNRLRPVVYDALEAVVLQHVLTGTCDQCPDGLP